MAGEQAGGGLADAALAGEEGDLAAAGDRRLDPRDEFALTALCRARPDRDEAGGGEVDGATPTPPRRSDRRPDRFLRGQIAGTDRGRARLLAFELGGGPVAVCPLTDGERACGQRHDVVFAGPEPGNVAVSDSWLPLSR